MGSDGKGKGRKVKLEKVSVSQIAAFDSTQPAGCPRRWWFRYVDGRKEPETVAKARGTDFHKEIEHYLLTGEDVLRPEVRVGKHLIDRTDSQLIEVSIPHSTTKGSIGLLFPDDSTQTYTQLVGRVDRFDEGSLHLDGEGNAVLDGFPEILDWKTTSSIAAYAKSGAQLATDPQMIGYASALFRPDGVQGIVSDSVTHVRLSHVYFQTRGARAAAKRTIVASREHVTEGYHRLCEVVDDMRKVARLPVVDDVPKNLSACSAYGGCPHAAYCPKTSAEALRGIWSKTDMSLLTHMKKSTLVPHAAAQQIAPPAIPVAPAATLTPVAAPNAAQAARAAALRAELQALEQQSAEESDDATCEACGEDLTIHNLSRLQDGTIRHIGCKSAPAPITPPDQPPITQRFEPVPAESIAALPPAARAAAEAAPPPAPVEKRRPGRPRKAPAPAGQVAEHTVPAAVPVQEIRKVDPVTAAAEAQDVADAREGASRVQIPEAALEPVREAREATVREVAESREILRQACDHMDRRLARLNLSEHVAEQTEVRTFGPFNILLLDCCVELPGANGRPDVLDLGPELDGYAQSLAQKHNAAELRCAPSDGPLSYGKWQGALTAVLRECFKVPATHRVFTLRTRGDAVRELAAAAIAHKFDLVVWGGR